MDEVHRKRTNKRNRTATAVQLHVRYVLKHYTNLTFINSTAVAVVVFLSFLFSLELRSRLLLIQLLRSCRFFNSRNCEAVKFTIALQIRHLKEWMKSIGKEQTKKIELRQQFNYSCGTC